MELLKQLIEAKGPVGFETNVQRVFYHHMLARTGNIKVDAYGNVIAQFGTGSKQFPSILFTAHADELGFQVSYVNDEGFIAFLPLGGHDEKIVPGRHIVIHTANGLVPGVIGSKAVHTQTSDEYYKAGKINKMWIDIGAKDRDRALELVAIGDPITYVDTFKQLDGNIIAGRGFDDKAGLFAIARCLDFIKQDKMVATLHLASTVQEEVGFKGARMTVHGVTPDIAIAVDVCFTTDCPDMEKKELGDTKLDGGPILTRGPLLNHKVFNRLVNVAKENEIPYQVMAANEGTGTEADVFQITKSGIPTALISIPNRYTHTPVELVSMDDLTNTARLLAAFAESVNVEDNWNIEL